MIPKIKQCSHTHTHMQYALSDMNGIKLKIMLFAGVVGFAVDVDKLTQTSCKFTTKDGMQSGYA